MKCEFCKKRNVRGDSTVCSCCDRRMEITQLKELHAKEKKHGAKYRCLTCKDPLPLSRARYCLRCVSTWEMEAREDMYSLTMPDQSAFAGQTIKKGQAKWA